MKTEWGSVPEWISAGCAIAGVIGLAVYAFDTHAMRKGLVLQMKASQRPFFMSIQPNAGMPPELVNSGSGPVGEAYWKKGTENKPDPPNSVIWHSLGSFGIHQKGSLTIGTPESHIQQDYLPAEGIRVNYRDGSDNWYSLGVWVDSAGFIFEHTQELKPEEAYPNPFIRLTTLQRITQFLDNPDLSK